MQVAVRWKYLPFPNWKQCPQWINSFNRIDMFFVEDHHLKETWNWSKGSKGWSWQQLSQHVESREMCWTAPWLPGSWLSHFRSTTSQKRSGHSSLLLQWNKDSLLPGCHRKAWKALVTVDCGADCDDVRSKSENEHCLHQKPWIKRSTVAWCHVAHIPDDNYGYSERMRTDLIWAKKWCQLTRHWLVPEKDNFDRVLVWNSHLNHLKWILSCAVFEES